MMVVRKMTNSINESIGFFSLGTKEKSFPNYGFKIKTFGGLKPWSVLDIHPNP